MPRRTSNRSLAGNISTDWLIIGAGYAGIAAARRLAENEPDAAIVLVDACAVGEGASARNSGFVIDLPHNVGADLHDPDAQLRALRLARAAKQHIDDLVKNHAIECQWSQQGQMMGAKSKQGEAVLDGFMQGLDALNEPYTKMSATDLAARTGSTYYTRAVHTPGTILMQPAALVRGLADCLPHDKIQVFEDTPVTNISYNDTITAQTPNGLITAHKVILAVNGFAPDLGHYKNALFNLQLYCSMTRPLTDAEHDSLGAPENWGLVPSMAFGGPTIRYTMDRRLTMRSMFKHRHSGKASQSDYVAARRLQAQQIKDRFPQLPNDIITDTWMGQITLSQNFAPGFGQQADNVFTAVCQNGVGVTKGTISGLLAADLATGRDNPLLVDMLALGQPSKLPPRPFLDLGVNTKMKLWEFQQRHEA
ncbi:FAD-binding oxidoreductase [Amylibacter sp.]|nr:FAD-binding oxidoreductase [Amylibacter sp.]